MMKKIFEIVRSVFLLIILISIARSCHPKDTQDDLASESTTISTKTQETLKNSDITEGTIYDDTGRFVGMDGCEFVVDGPFDLDGVSYTINRIKISADRDSETLSYDNYHKIFYEYTIKNNRKAKVEWDMAYNGNLYGYLRHRGAERRLGGNSFIKDESFTELKYMPEGSLAAGGVVSGYNSLVCLPDSINFSDDTWPLYSDEPFVLELHLVVDEMDYVITISFNQVAK